MREFLSIVVYSVRYHGFLGWIMSPTGGDYDVAIVC